MIEAHSWLLAAGRVAKPAEATRQQAGEQRRDSCNGCMYVPVYAVDELRGEGKMRSGSDDDAGGRG